MAGVKPKKALGQHFLKNKQIAAQIVNSLSGHDCRQVIETGPGTGVLTGLLLQRPEFELSVVEIDYESADYLLAHYPQLNNRLHRADVLSVDFAMFGDQLAVIGNFPYNISSQIVFKVLDNRDRVVEMVGMFQKEVAQRIAAPPGGRERGILSVLVQAFYEVEYLFSVSDSEFHPPPKVQSGVIRLKRKTDFRLDCNEAAFFRLVKTAFNQRRKTLRNSLRSLMNERAGSPELLSKRPEQLSYEEFIGLTQWLYGS